MRRIVGHITVRFLIRRPLLSGLLEVYKSINAGIEKPTLRTPYYPLATMTDACLSGYAVGESPWSLDDLENVCKFDERWRFKGSAGDESHCEKALREYDDRMREHAQADVFSDVLAVTSSHLDLRGVLEEDFSFPDIDARLLLKNNWKMSLLLHCDSRSQCTFAKRGGLGGRQAPFTELPVSQPFASVYR